MSDPSGGVSQSMLIGLGVWVAFAYLWTFAPRFGVLRERAVASFGAAGVGGMLGARVMWWFSQGIEGGEFLGWEVLLRALNPLEPGYSSLGFLAGAGVVVVVLSRESVRGDSRGRLLDVVVLAGFLGMVFARLGCVFQGCDFGRVSDAYWFSIRYARGSQAWQRHVLDGLIGGEQAWSLPTHGFAIFSAGGTFLVVLVASLWVLRRGLGQIAGGEVAWRAIFAFCCVQVVVEFLRETPIGGTLQGLVNINQITLLGVMALMCVQRFYGYCAGKCIRHRETS